jgi:hypothetical protein
MSVCLVSLSEFRSILVGVLYCCVYVCMCVFALFTQDAPALQEWPAPELAVPVEHGEWEFLGNDGETVNVPGSPPPPPCCSFVLPVYLCVRV